MQNNCSIETFADAEVVAIEEFILREDGVEKTTSPSVPDLQNLLAEIAINHCKTGLKETIPGQCSSHFMFELTFNGKLLSKKYTALPCHLMNKHDGKHYFNYSRGFKIGW